MTWTTTPPTESGYYWIQIGLPEVAHVVWSEFRQCRIILRAGQDKPVDERTTDILRWCKVEEPKEVTAWAVSRNGPKTT